MNQSHAGSVSSRLRQSSITSTTKSKSRILKKLFKGVRKRMLMRYETDLNTYDNKILTEIIYNEKSHIVAQFKDFLIFDDLSEFLRRYYTYEESLARVPKITDYYDNYSKIFPNYINLPEAKYVYKNIQRKQKLIDTQQRNDNEIKEKEKISEKRRVEEDKIFNTDVYESIMNGTALLQTEGKEAGREEREGKISENEYKEKGANEKFDYSILSIEKLIGSIDNAEKFEKLEKLIKIKTDKSEKNNEPVDKINKIIIPTKSKNTLQHKDSIHCASPRITQRNFNIISKKLLSPLTRKDSTLLEKISIPKFDKNKLKTFEVNSRHKMTSSRNSLFNKLLSSHNIINEQIDKENEKLNFESKLLHTKYKEIRKRNKASADISNITALKDKMKDTFTTLCKSVQWQRHLKEINKSISKIGIKDDDKGKEKEKEKGNYHNIAISHHKNNLSVPKLTNNIFYIINQNPQVNTQITIYNNQLENKDSSLKLTTRETSAYKIKSNTGGYTIINKEKDVSPITTPLTSRKLNNNKTKTISQFNRDNTGSYTNRQAKAYAVNASTLKNTLGTIVHDDLTSRKMNHKSINTRNLDKNATVSSERRDIPNRTKKISTTRASSPLTQSLIGMSGIKHQNYMNANNKTSLSQNAQIALKTSYLKKNEINSYNHKKTKSGHILDVKTSITTLNPTQTKTILSNKIFDSNKVSTVKLNAAKGIPIKNFNEVLKVNSKGIANSDRSYVCRVDRMNKIK